MDAAVVQGDGVRCDAASQGLRGRFGFGDVHDAAVQGKAVTHPDAVAATDVQRAGAAKGKYLPCLLSYFTLFNSFVVIVGEN